MAVLSHTRVASASDEKGLKQVADELTALRDRFHAQNIAKKVEQSSMDEDEIKLYSHYGKDDFVAPERANRAKAAVKIKQR